MSYGAGCFDGKPYDAEINHHRKQYLRGPLVFAPELKTGFTCTAASGFAGRYYSVPFGTYLLHCQSVGWIIENLYHRFNIGIHQRGFANVWNVGTPINECSTGYDSAAGRSRHEIQIHCEPRMVSQGCIVMNERDFPVFAEAMESLEWHNKLGLIVSPNGNPFTIFKIGERK